MKTITISKDKEGLRINNQLVKFHYSNGIVMIENNSVGVGHSCHPNIDGSGSVEGMKMQGYWDKKDVVVRAHGFAYNTSHIVISDEIDLLAYHMQVNGYEIPKKVLDGAGNPLWGGVTLSLPEIGENINLLQR